MDFEYRRSTGDRDQKVKMCAILFARPEVDLAGREIFPQIEYFHERTGPHVNIFVAGCNGGLQEFVDEGPVGRTGEWRYSDIAFNEARLDFQSRTSWRHTEGAELLLANATFNPKKNEASIDFGSAIAVDLIKARATDAIQSIAQLIGRLADYCETTKDSNDPTWGFSDRSGGHIVKSAIWHLFISFLPESLRQDADAAKLFVRVDLRK